MKNPKDLYHPMKEDERPSSCKVITWAVGAGIIFMIIYVLLTMTPFLNVIFGGK